MIRIAGLALAFVLTATGASAQQYPSPRFQDLTVSGAFRAANSPVVNVVDKGAKCDGVTDDNAAIQAVITANTARVYVPNTGSPCLMTTLDLPSNSHITVDGTLKIKSGNIGGAVLQAATGSPSNITIDGSGTLDANAAGVPSGIQANIYLYQASNVWISGVTLTNSRNFPLNVVASSHVFVSQIRSINNVGTAEFAQGSFDCWIDNSEISGSSMDYGFSFYGGVHDSGITNSRVFNNTADGISVLNDASQPDASYGILIANNVVYGNAANGIGTRTDAPASAAHQHITIIGNTLHDNNQGNVGGYGGVWLNNVAYVAVSHNNIYHDGAGSNSSVGITILPAAYNVAVSGNIISDEGQGGTNGIGITSQGPYASITENIVYDGQGSQTMAFAMSGSLGIDSIVANNLLGPTIGAANVMGYSASTAYTQTLTLGGPQHISQTIADFPFTQGGTKFTTSGCSISATTGTGTTGIYTSGTTGTCAAVITINGATGMTATNGWNCTAADWTTPADAQAQTATTATTATISGTTASGDVIHFGCQPY